MQCPYCREMDSRVVDSRLAAGGTVTWRRRECDGCKRRFTTYERLEYTLPSVVKKNGQREAFNREKLLRSLRVACNKRPISIDVFDARPHPVVTPKLRGDLEVVRIENSPRAVLQILVAAPNEARRDVA